MKRRWISLVMVLVLLGSLMWIPCQASENNDVDKEPLNTENVMPADESGSEGGSGGSTEGGNGGSTEGGNGGSTEGGNSGGTTEGGSGTDKDDSSDTPPTQETTPKNPTYTDEEEKKTFGFCKHEYGEWEAQKWAHVRRCKKCWAFQSKAHVYNDSYAMDDEKNGHWLVCDDCGYQKSFSDHVMGEKYQNDGTGHWLACTLCDMKEEAEAHIPGPGANETRDQLCTVCEYIMVPKGTITENAPIPTEETVPVEETEAVVVTWEYNDLTHWQDDGSGEKHNQSVHKWDSGAKQPDDSTVYVCTVCSAMMVDDGSDEQNAFIKGAMAAGFVVVMVILAGALFMFLIKSKNPGRYSGRKSRR